jgi:hypothetical protein
MMIKRLAEIPAMQRKYAGLQVDTRVLLFDVNVFGVNIKVFTYFVFTGTGCPRHRTAEP